MRVGALLVLLGVMGACSSDPHCDNQVTTEGGPEVLMLTVEVPDISDPLPVQTCPIGPGPGARHGGYWARGIPSDRNEDCGACFMNAPVSGHIPEGKTYNEATCVNYPKCLDQKGEPAWYTECHLRNVTFGDCPV